MFEKAANIFFYPKDGSDYVIRNRLLYYVLLFCLIFKFISIILPSNINSLAKLICGIKELEGYILFLNFTESILSICFILSFITSCISVVSGIADIITDKIFHKSRSPSTTLGNINVKAHEIFLNQKQISLVFIKIMFSAIALLWIFDIGEFMIFFNYLMRLYNDSSIIITLFFLCYFIYIMSALIDFALFFINTMFFQHKLGEIKK